MKANDRIDDEYYHKLIIKEKAKREKIERQAKHKKEPNLLAVDQMINKYFVVNKLKILCDYLTISKNILHPSQLLYHQKDILFIDDVVRNLKSNNNLDPLIEVYYSLSNLLRKMPEFALNEYEHTKLLIEDNVDSWAVTEAMEICMLLNNYLLRIKNSGAEFLRVDIFLLYNRMLNISYRSKNLAWLSPNLFKNIVFAALGLDHHWFYTLKTKGLSPKGDGFKDAFDWTSRFLEYYGPKINPKNDRRLFVDYCQAYIHFKIGDFGNAKLILLDRSNWNGHYFIQLNWKILLLKSCFELALKNSDQDAIITSNLESYRAMVQYYEPKLAYQAKEHKKFYTVFLKLFELYNMQHWVFKDLEKIKRKQKEINIMLEEPFIMFKHWLSEKFEKLTLEY